MSKIKKAKSVLINNTQERSHLVIKVNPKTDEQKNALRAIDQNKITIIEGPAGSGKTYTAVLYGLQMLNRGKFDRLIFTRPIVEAGESLGFLPGNVEDKVFFYMLPIF